MFTFKKQPRETGLRAIGAGEPATDIKRNKKVVGQICGPNWQTKDNKWRVRFTIFPVDGTGNPNCDWSWITLKATFDTEPEARVFVNKYFDAINEKYKLREDDE